MPCLYDLTRLHRQFRALHTRRMLIFRNFVGLFSAQQQEKDKKVLKDAIFRVNKRLNFKLSI